MQWIGKLGLPLHELSEAIGISYASAKAYASGVNDRLPPEDVLKALEAEILKRAISRVQKAGLQVS